MADRSTVYVQDAAIDEYIASVLLTVMPGYALQANVIVDADCIGGPAMNTAWKLNQFLGADIPLGLSAARGVNPFPWPYRSDCVAMGEIADLSGYPANPNWPWYPPGDADPHASSPRPGIPPTGEGLNYPDGDALLGAALDRSLAQGEQFTLVVNCPFTPVATVLGERPDRATAIERVIWMGGAVDLIQGNLDPKTLPTTVANPYAEWNAFWDPLAVDWVFRNTSFPIVMFPLNVTNDAVITKEFMSALQQQAATCRYSRLAFDAYSIVSSEPFYSMWDVTSVCYLTQPGLFDTPRTMRLDILTEGYYQGTIYSDDAGRAVDVVMSFADKAAFYTHVLGLLQR
ncbi:hypothetical protein CMK11_04165 [Candidatus Poribacteria bacterium]|nr:hypothetical protein [Candidatus Poribacteria bacterium]